MNMQELQSRFEKVEYVLNMGPENFSDYDFADEAQADAELLLEALNDVSEYREPELYAGLLEDLVNSLEALEAHLS